MSDEDPLDARLALGWQALSPPAGSMARVRARVLGDPGPSPSGGGGPGGSSPSGAGPGRRVERGTDMGTRLVSGGRAARWHALKASGALGWAVGASLLALGFGLGFSLRPAARAPDAQPAAPPGAASDAARGDDVPVRLGIPREAETHGAPRAQGVTPADDARQTAGGPRSSPRTGTRAPAAGPRPRESTPRALPTTRPPAIGPGDADELRMLERAERALRGDNPELSLALLQTLDEARPHTGLWEERRALKLMALCRTAAPESAARGADFTRRYPSSVYAERIRVECARPTNGSEPDMNSSEGDSHVKP